MKTSHKIFLLFFFLALGVALKAGFASAAPRFWGGGTGTWDATDTTHWAATTGGAGGQTVPGSADTVTFDALSGGGTITLSYAPTVTSITGGAHTGTFDTGGNTINASTFSYTGTGTRTLTLGASAINLSGTNNASVWNTTTVTNLTFNANTSTITLSGANGGLTSTTLTFSTAVFSGSGKQRIDTGAATLTFLNLTRTGTDVKTDEFAIGGSMVVTGTLTLNGYSITNRLFMHTDVNLLALGTNRTIDAATVSVTNTDFADITGAGAGSWDLSAISGGSGNIGGNSGITFTTADENFWIGDTGNWSTAGEWSTSSGGAADGRTPLPQDNATFDGSSFSGTGFTVTLDMPRAGKNITWTNLGSDNPAWAKTTATTVYGSVTMVSGMTNSGTAAFSLRGRIAEAGGGGSTWTSAGQTWTNPITVAAFGGTYILQDAFLSSSSITITHGTLNDNNFNVTVTSFTSVAPLTGTLTMGTTNTWTLTSTGTIWNVTSGAVINANTSTISMTDVSASAKTFAGGGKTYGAISIASDGTAGTTTFTGANTFASMTIGAGGIKSIVLPGSTTTTITASSGLGNGTNVITFTASAGSATISSATGNFCWDYVNLTNIPSTGGATFYAGANSTDGLGNTGWSFTNCRATTPSEKIRGGVKVRGGVKFR